MTMLSSPTRLAALACLLPTMATPALAQTPDATGPSWVIFGAQRFWFATQNVKLFDAAVVVPASGSEAPVLQSRLSESVGTAIVPITALGVRRGKAQATLSLSPSTGFGAGDQVPGGQINRRELDFSVGYEVMPAITVSLIYKNGEISPTTTSAANALFNFRSDVGKGHAVLLGVSSSAALQGALSVYGNLAYGGGRWKSVNETDVIDRYPSRYTVADFGLAWRAGGPANVTVQFGYRSQTVTLKRVDLPTVSLETPPRVLSTQYVKAPSTTQGVIMSLSAAF